MAMKIIVPKKYEKYLEALQSCGYGNNQTEVATKLFTKGLEEVLLDTSMRATKPDMDESFQEDLRDIKEKTIIEISDEIENIDKVPKLSKLWGYTIEHTKSIIFVQGLGIDGYLNLLDSPNYNDDLQFKNMVDTMPHDYGLMPDEKILALEDDEFDFE